MSEDSNLGEMIGGSVLNDNVITKGTQFSNEETSRRDIEKKYQSLERNFLIRNASEYENLVNFSTSQKYPIHRWYYYQEGYSPSLVQKLFREFGATSQSRILDSFCGCGTTLLGASQEKMKSIGFDVNPFSAFCSMVKTRSYSEDEIESFKKIVNEMRDVNFKPTLSPPKSNMMDRLFDKDVLEKLLMYKEFILRIDDITKERIRNLLMFGWLSILEQVSNYRKGGNGLKKKTRPSSEKNVKQKLFSKYNLIYNDLRNSNLNSFSMGGSSHFVEPEIHNESCLKVREFADENSIDFIIFSPPYVNCFDYCEVYKIELWMGDFVHNYEELRELRLKSIRSHVNVKWGNSDLTEIPSEPLKAIVEFLSSQKLWNGNIPKMLQGYFTDMNNIMSSLFDVLIEGGKCAIVVSNSAYGNIVIPTDLLLAQIAEEVGFKCEEIKVARRNETSSQQHRKLKEFEKYLRESILILNK